MSLLIAFPSPGGFVPAPGDGSNRSRRHASQNGGFNLYQGVTLFCPHSEQEECNEKNG